MLFYDIISLMNLRLIFFFVISFFYLESCIDLVLASGEGTADYDIYSENKNNNCMTNEEHGALKIRIMQDQINVASRNCSNIDKQLFLKIERKFEKIFDKNNIVLEIFFQKLGVDNPNKELNYFVTENANAASLKVIYHKKKFCTKQQKIITDLLDIDQRELPKFAIDRIEQKISDPKLCN